MRICVIMMMLPVDTRISAVTANTNRPPWETIGGGFAVVPLDALSI